jgi:hypothetical protein
LYAEFGDAKVKTPVVMIVVMAELVSAGYGQDPKAENTPFTLTWTKRL